MTEVRNLEGLAHGKILILTPTLRGILGRRSIGILLIRRRRIIGIVLLLRFLFLLLLSLFFLGGLLGISAAVQQHIRSCLVDIFFGNFGVTIPGSHCLGSFFQSQVRTVTLDFSFQALADDIQPIRFCCCNRRQQIGCRLNSLPKLLLKGGKALSKGLGIILKCHSCFHDSKTLLGLVLRTDDHA